MKILNLQQGSPEWAAVRARHFTASEASAMMGASKHTSRSDLLRLKATGDAEEVGPAKQRVFDRGHEVEALARPFAEAIIGEELYPATAVDDDDYLLASFDGITMLEDTVWECKQWNADKAEDVRADRCPAEDAWQVVQQLVVSGADRCLYMVTDGTEGGTVHCWVTLHEGQREYLLAGWAQFEKDLAEYVPEAPKADPVGRAPDALPALRIEVQGAVTASNLAEFKAHALDVIGSINTDLQTDAHFADAERTVKWCREVETRLDAAKDHALSQTASIDQLFRAIGSIKDEARAKRLELDRLVKDRKQEIKLEIAGRARTAFAQHVAEIDKRIAPARLPEIPVDIAGAMKGKKTVATLQGAADDELARAKIAADTAAKDIETNLRTLRELAANRQFLFSDTQTLVLKSNDDLVTLIKARIAEHEAAEEQRRDAERERIRREEQQKLEAEQREADQRAKDEAEAKADLERLQQEFSRPQPEAQRAEEPSLKLGDIRDRLGIALPAEFIADTLGVQPAGKQRSAVLYRESDFHRICTALARHAVAVRDGEHRQAA